MARKKGRARATQQVIAFHARGGARPGAGRKPRGAKPGVSHAERKPLSGREPVLVTLKMRPEIWNLRTRRTFTRVVRSIFLARERFGTRLVHFSTQRDHVHLMVEAASRASLSRAMQGLCVRIARALNRTMGRKGTVFADRYHDRVLRTPRQVRNALRYVLGNARKHGVLPDGLRFDPWSSAAAFDGWIDGVLCDLAASLRARVVSRARTWLLAVGWRRGGLLDPADCPGRSWASTEGA